MQRIITTYLFSELTFSIQVHLRNLRLSLIPREDIPSCQEPHNTATYRYHKRLTTINNFRKTMTEMIITPAKHVNKGLTDLLSANARLCPVQQELMHFDFVLEVPVDDYTFSGGLVIPAGNDMFSPNSPALFDENEYPNPDSFDGFRSYRLRQKVGQSENRPVQQI